MSTRCMNNFTVKDNNGNEVEVPCGKCPACKSRRASSWSFRLMQEEKVSYNSVFATLTYSTEHVPITEKGYMTLDKTDVQKFMKRLRKQSERTIKYYIVGEYGSNKLRPHYHGIIFNAEIQEIENAWQLGECHYGQVTGASIGYTLKYMCKEPVIPMHQNDDRLKEFSLMSKGLGKNYINERTVKYHHADLPGRVCITIEDGKKIPMPRYFKQKIYTPEQMEIIAYQNKINADRLMMEYQADMIKKHGAEWENVERQIHLNEIKKMHRTAIRGRRLD